jgi:ubiquinone/menaquinone biosynthesis C-methylase UbiE
MEDKILEIRSRWDEFSSSFEKYFQQSTMTTAYSMLTFMKINESKSIIEIGCGAGGAGNLAQNLLQEDCKFIMTDLSSKMLELARKRLEKSKLLPKPEFLLANAYNIPVESESFDRLYGNYVIHLAPEPQLILQEAKRILKPGGIAGFSVWGRPENSPKFTLSDKVKEKMGLEVQPCPAFHLCDIEKFKKMVLDAGFSKVIAWYQTELLNVHDSTEFSNTTIYGNPFSNKFFHSLSPEQQQKFKEELIKEADIFFKKGEPISNEALIVICFK